MTRQRKETTATTDHQHYTVDASPREHARQTQAPRGTRPPGKCPPPAFESYQYQGGRASSPLLILDKAQYERQQKAVVVDGHNAHRMLVSALREHACQLRGEPGVCRGSLLAEFRSRKCGEDDAFLPRDTCGELWRGLAAPVTRDELTRADYAAYALAWHEEDPWRHIRWGGEAPLWRWDYPENSQRATRILRAVFLDRLASVVAMRGTP